MLNEPEHNKSLKIERVSRGAIHKQMKIKTLIIIFIVLSTSTYLYGCEQIRSEADTTLFNKWQFTGFQKANSTEQDVLPNDIEVHIEFLPSNDIRQGPHKLKGKAPCNTYRGSLEITNKQEITIHSLISTKMACERKNRKENQRKMLEWEALYLDALNRAESYTISNNELRIYFNNNDECLIYTLVH